SSPCGHEWGYFEERDAGGEVSAPRGKVIGGCSAYNHCAALWGLPADYDRWAEAGNPGWSYADLRPLIDQVERNEGGAPAYRGMHGPLPTRSSAAGELAHWQRAFVESARAAGFPTLSDLSAPDPLEGVAPLHLNVRGPI